MLVLDERWRYFSKPTPASAATRNQEARLEGELDQFVVGSNMRPSGKNDDGHCPEHGNIRPEHSKNPPSVGRWPDVYVLGAYNSDSK